MAAQIIVWTLYTYLLVGAVFGLWFIFYGVNKLDDNMKGASVLMRLLLLPGAVGLWVALLPKFFKKTIS